MLDKGVVIAGDIQINLLDIELLTIKLRLLVVSVDKAKEMGIDWWENDPSLSSRAPEAVRARREAGAPLNGGEESGELAAENERLRQEIERLRSAAELPAGEDSRRQTEQEPGQDTDRSGSAGKSGGGGTGKRGG